MHTHTHVIFRSLSGVRSQVEVQAALQAEGGRAYADYEDHLVLVGVCGIKVRLRPWYIYDCFMYMLIICLLCMYTPL